MAFTSLHRAVGAPPGEITEQILLDAESANIAEADDLDWKAELDEVKDGREFGKDVAAMANAVGGLIIFGMSEDGSERANELCGVEDSRRVIKSLRSKASVVRPFIPGLRIYRVPLSKPIGRDAVVVEVPRSPEAPHLVVWEKESWRYPKRRGTDTDWLGENDLEAAYAARFARRHDTETRLRKLLDEVAERRLVMNPQSVWVAVAATCSVPAPQGAAPEPDFNTAEPSVLRALNDLPGDRLLGAKLRIMVPSVGLRRAVVSSDSPFRGMSEEAHLELHFDGSFAGALEVGRQDPKLADCSVAQRNLEVAVRDLVTVAMRHAKRSNADGMFQAIADIRFSGSLTLGRSEYAELYTPFGARLNHPLTSVVSEAPLLDLRTDAAQRDRLIRQLATDLVHQFAVQRLAVL